MFGSIQLPSSPFLIPKVSVISTFYNISIQKFHDSREFFRVPAHAHDVLVFDVYLEFLVPQVV